MSASAVENAPAQPLNDNVNHTNGHAPVDGQSGLVLNGQPVSVPVPDAVDVTMEESDARHEPAPAVKLDKLDVVSTVPDVQTPIDPASIPIKPPHGTPPPPPGQLLEDVKMAEGASNGDTDATMRESPAHATNGLNGATSDTAINVGAGNYRSPHPMDEDDAEPPAKRVRTFSDADKASVSHSATPPPTTGSTVQTNGNTATPTPTPATGSMPPPQSTLSPQQHRLCLSAVRQLKKNKDAAPFLKPVDPVALNIPHYPSIIKNPMDLSTVERKLNSSNPAKPDPNLANPRYYNTDEFIADVRLIVNNSVTFNGPDHVVTAMGKRMEEMFDKLVKHMPPPLEPKPPTPKKQSTPPAPPPAQVKRPGGRRPSTSVPVIRRSEQEPVGRPKREIHPPPPKDLPYESAPKKTRKIRHSIKDDGTAEQLKFCGKVLNDLHRKSHWTIAHPFYEPVDWVKLDIPSYPKIVKKPMDLSTMRKKLDNGEYANAQAFRTDFQLMIRNCFSFNPAGTPVNLAGSQLQRLFDEKWLGLPPLHPESEEEEEEDESEDERAREIAEMEREIERMRSNIASIKQQKAPAPKKEKKKREKHVAPPAPKPAKREKAATSPKKRASTGGGGGGGGKKPIAEDDTLSFEQKKDLSEAISTLDGQKLEKVIQIIHEGVPEIRDSTEEIELEIDLLPPSVLTKLYNFVLRPPRGQGGAPKRSRGKGGTATGGLNRKSMDEVAEAEKIRRLEERMAMFEGGGGHHGGSSSAPVASKRDSEHSSDSSSGDDSSGSDTE